MEYGIKCNKMSLIFWLLWHTECDELKHAADAVAFVRRAMAISNMANATQRTNSFSDSKREIVW